MGQKVHANGLRLGFTKGWNSLWYNPLYTQGYANMLIEDLKIQKYIKGSLYGSKKFTDLIKIYRNNLGTYIYFSYIKKLSKKNKLRNFLLLRNRKFKIKALRLKNPFRGKFYLNHLNKRTIIKKLIKRKNKFIINKLKYYNKFNINFKNYIVKEHLNNTHILKDKNKHNIMSVDNSQSEFINSTRYEKFIYKNFKIDVNNYKNFKFYKKSKNRYKNFKIYSLKKIFNKKRKNFYPLLNILKIKKKLNLITYSKIFLYLYRTRQLKKLPYNNVLLIATLLANTFKIHTKLFSKIFKKYSKIFKIIYPQYIKGVRIKYSGKTWGKGRAKTHSIKFGNIPLNNINELIDYSFVKSQNKFGVIGIKVWVNHYHFGKNSKYKYLRSKERKLLAQWRHTLSPIRLSDYDYDIREYSNNNEYLQKDYRKNSLKYNHNVFSAEKFIRYNLIYQSKIKKFFKKHKFYNSFIKKKHRVKNINAYYYSRKFFNTIKYLKKNINYYSSSKKNAIIKLTYKSAIKKSNIHSYKLLNKNDNKLYNLKINKSIHKNKFTSLTPMVVQKRGYAEYVKFNKVTLHNNDNISNKRYISTNIVDKNTNTKIIINDNKLKTLSNRIDKIIAHYDKTSDSYKYYYHPNDKKSIFMKKTRYINKYQKSLHIKPIIRKFPKLKTSAFNYYNKLQSYNKLSYSIFNYKLYDLYNRLINLNQQHRIERLGLKISPKKYFIMVSRGTNQFTFYNNKKYLMRFIKQKQLPYKNYIKCIYDKRPLAFRFFNKYTKFQIRRNVPFKFYSFLKRSRKINLPNYIYPQSRYNTFKRLGKLFALKPTSQLIHILTTHNHFKNISLPKVHRTPTIMELLISLASDNPPYRNRNNKYCNIKFLSPRLHLIKYQIKMPLVLSRLRKLEINKSLNFYKSKYGSHNFRSTNYNKTNFINNNNYNNKKLINNNTYNHNNYNKSNNYKYNKPYYNYNDSKFNKSRGNQSFNK